MKQLLTRCVAIAGAMALGGCDPGNGGVLCTLMVQERHTSPDGRFMAVVFERDCGVAGSTTQLTIAPAGGSIPNAPANLFVADRRSALDVRWESPEELTVIVPAAVQPERADSTVLGIRVNYLTRQPGAQPDSPPVSDTT